MKEMDDKNVPIGAESIKESEEKLRTIFQNVNDVISYVDKFGRILDVNERIKDLFGYSRDEVIGKHFAKLGIVKLNDLPKILKLFRTTIKNRSPEAFVELELRHKDGHSVFVEVATSFIKEDNKVKEILNVFRDITERKRLESDIIKLNNCFLKFGADSGKNISIIVETAGGILNGICALYNRLEGDMLITKGKWQVPKDMPPIDKANGHICLDVISSGKEHFIVKNLDCSLYAETDPNVKKYNLKTYIGHVVKVKDKPVGSLCVVYQENKEFMRHDVEILSILAKALGIEEERMRMEEELIHSERMAGIGLLAAGVAHEFNNLLNIIEGTAEYAKSIKNVKEIKESLDIILKNSFRGVDIVRGLLRFAGRTETRKELADIVEVLEEVLHLVKRDLERGSIKLAVNYSGVPKTLVDIGQIQQVFLNIISNTQNAMPNGGKLSIDLRRKADFIEIKFHNTGKIIEKEDLPRLFTPFYTTREKQEEGWPGTGLGLSVSYGIVQAHGGKIEVESQKGKGTTFTVRLPILEKDNKRQIVDEEAIRTSGKDKIKAKQAQILIVDDELSICSLFKKVLEKDSHIVTAVTDGKSAVKLCGEKSFDLIYIDIVMPGMDGSEVFDKILKIDPGSRIVFMTGRLMEDKVASMLIEKGAVGFLRKPISMSKLVSYTKGILSEKNE